MRSRVRLRKDQRTSLHSWSFHQLGAFLECKARRAGVPLVYADPAYTSRQCSQCGHIAGRTVSIKQRSRAGPAGSTPTRTTTRPTSTGRADAAGKRGDPRLQRRTPSPSGEAKHRASRRSCPADALGRRSGVLPGLTASATGIDRRKRSPPRTHLLGPASGTALVARSHTPPVHGIPPLTGHATSTERCHSEGRNPPMSEAGKSLRRV
ncbi:zinc ribbon domain-containing protein [Streptomyces sp. NPDC087908]|uniref:zinc ribbon domain-containing protein n=1 Tax=Streptomyces sp. NPDC087908 TaxID=3365820 RepID=UPI0037F76461